MRFRTRRRQLTRKRRKVWIRKTKKNVNLRARVKAWVKSSGRGVEQSDTMEGGERERR